MTYKSFIVKYSPKTIDKLEYLDIYNYLKMLPSMGFFRNILVGDTSVGKTTIIQVIKLYLKDTYKIMSYTDYINNANYITNLSNKKIVILIDNIDYINNRQQHKIKKIIDNTRINLIATAKNITNILDNIEMRCVVLKINSPPFDYTVNVLETIAKAENIQIDEYTIKYIVKDCNKSIGLAINFLEKIYMIKEKASIALVQQLSTNISYIVWEDYIKSCKLNDLSKITTIINTIKSSGKTMIDILSSLLMYVKYTSLFNCDDKYKLIVLIIKYIHIFYTIEETYILMYFFTNKLIILLDNICLKI